jgi:ABC-2 type transport system permease protein
MKKYLSFFRMRFLMGLQYRAAAAAGVVTSLHGDLWNFLSLEHFIRQMRLPFQ